jgi:heme/copper-type cytochrome/quinol oxidase subunit 3
MVQKVLITLKVSGKERTTHQRCLYGIWLALLISEYWHILTVIWLIIRKIINRASQLSAFIIIITQVDVENVY